MRRYFKSRKKKKHYLIWYILIILVVIIVDNMYIRYMEGEDIVNNNIIKALKVDIKPDTMLLFLGLNHYVSEIKPVQKLKPVFTEVENNHNYDYKNPTIYLYNTHQTEEYSNGDIFEASKYLKKKLSEYDIETILEETDIADELRKNDLAYKDSYKITRELLLKHINDNVSLYIDLHRDSSSYSVSTVEIDNKKYAKILFVVGGKHENFDENYLVAEHLNRLLKNYKQEISRGIFVRQSSSYNQDLNSNVILIELGGPYNSMEEIKNSVDVLCEVLAQFIGE